MKKIKVINKAVDWFSENSKQIDKKHLEKIYLKIEIE